MSDAALHIMISDYTTMRMAVSSNEGDIIYNLIYSQLKKGQNVIADFAGIELLTTAFLNIAIGQLYKDFNSSQISEKLKLMNVSELDLPLFKKVTDRAKLYYKDVSSFNQTVDNILK